jgi:hypothetical protein
MTFKGFVDSMVRLAKGIDDGQYWFFKELW